MTAPLDGLLVVGIDQAVAAPFTASRLADAGARVIKIERPGGDFARGYDAVVGGESAYFVWLNRGKESVELDLKREDDLALLRGILAQADVFLQNLAPGAAARLGLGSEALRSVNPRLVTCDFSGYGEEGPYRDMKAYDLLVQAETGLASITGTPDAPGRVGFSIADIACGMYAYAAVLEALVRRTRTGVGAAIAVSLFDAIADWMTVPYLHHMWTGHAPPRVGLAHPSICPYGAFPTGDGAAILVAVQNEREWARLCEEVLMLPDLAADQRCAGNAARCRNRDLVEGAIRDVFETIPHDDLVAKLRDARIAFGALNDVAGLAEHPQLRLMAVETPAGPVRHPATPARSSTDRTATSARVPHLGEHTEAVRAEFAPGRAARAR